MLCVPPNEVHVTEHDGTVDEGRGEVHEEGCLLEEEELAGALPIPVLHDTRIHPVNNHEQVLNDLKHQNQEEQYGEATEGLWIEA